MRAGELDLYVEQGADWTRIITLYLQDGTKKNLSGCSVAMQMKQTAQDNSPVCVPTVQILSPVSQGQVQITINSQQSSSIPALGNDYSQTTRYTYDLYLTESNGERKRILNGEIYISPGVTK